MTFHFDALIAPISRAEFFERYWEKKPLLLKNRKVQGHQGLMGLKEFDSLLFSLTSSQSQEHPWMRMAHSQKGMMPQQEFIHPVSGLLDRHKVMAAFKSGATINLINQEERFEPLRELCQEFEEVLGHPNKTELFLTPPKHRGFKAHYDKYEAFILHLDGCKHWKIYDVVMPCPLLPSDTPYHGELPEPILEVDLHPGDLLYLPRGYVHQASATDVHALHVTVAVDVYTWLDLIGEIVKEEPEMRRSLPIGMLFAEFLESDAADPLQKCEEYFNNIEKVEAAVRRLRAKFAARKKSSFPESFTAPQSERAITPDTLFKKRKGVLCSLIVEEDQTLLHFDAEKIAGPLHLEPALQYIIENAHFTMKSLPNSLTESGKAALVQSLLKAGLLVFA